MMMWFMDTIYKIVVSNIYIYIILYSTGSVPFRGLTKHVWMLPDFAASGNSQDRDGYWSSPISAGEDPQAHDILLVLLAVVIYHDLSHCTHQRYSKIIKIQGFSSRRLAVSVLICCRYLSIYEAEHEPGPRTLEYMEEREYQVQPLLCGCWAFLHSVTDVSTYGQNQIHEDPKPVLAWFKGPPFVPNHQNRWVRSPEVTSNSPPCSTAFPQVFPIGSII